MALTADESMATLVDFRTYATARLWAEASAVTSPDANVEAALRGATDFLIANVSWPGLLASEAQVLPFPRNNAYDRERRLLSGTPAQAKSATIEVARLILLYGPDLGAATAASTAQVIRKKVGPLDKSFSEVKPQAVLSTRLAYVRSLLTSIGARLNFGGGLNVGRITRS